MIGSLVIGRPASEGAFDSPALRAVLRSWFQETRYRVCLVSASSMVPYLQMPELRGVPAIVDLVDVDSQKWLDYAAISRPPRSWLYRLEGRRLRRLEQELPSWTRAVTLVSEAEANILRPLAGPGREGEAPAEPGSMAREDPRPPGRIQVITNGVDLEYFRPTGETDETGCLFVGALDYLPNMDGISWFCREAWQGIRRRHPEAKITVVGRQPTAAVRRLAHLPGVEVIGQVPDVRPYYAQATVVVAPLRLARGVQNKLLEALAMGKALVASSTTLAGLKAQPGVHLLRADSSAEWQTAISQLLENRSLREQLGAAGRQYVEDNHRWDQCLEPLRQLLLMRDSI